jgi:hypothetical protein
MKKIFIAGLVGGVILFVWGFLAWVLLPLHTNSIKTLSNEEAVIAALNAGSPAKAVYMFPAQPPKAQVAETEAWIKRMEKGPTGMVVFDPGGMSMMMPLQMVIGFINGVLSVMLAAWLLSRSTAANGSYFSRVAFCGMLGIFISLSAHVVQWNWMNYPFDYMSGVVVDTVIAWTLVGLGVGKIIKGGS